MGKKISDRFVTDGAGLPSEEDAAVKASDIRGTMRRIRKYAEPYRELVVRSEQADHLERMLVGLTSNLERKSVEPIAVMHNIPRRVLQRFVGENGWRAAPLVERLRAEVGAELGAPDAAVIVDGSATPKKGEETVGVARQWCGRLGKVDNCVIGVHAAYVGKNELATLVASELFLPEEWTTNGAKRQQAYIPDEVDYCSQPEIAGGLVAELAGAMPFTWVLGDDEYGRARHFRDSVAELGKSYVLDVPANTVVHRIHRKGKIGGTPFSVERLAKSRPVAEWSHFKVRDGEKGPIEVRALAVDVATKRDAGRWVRETLLVVETLDASQRWYCLARTPAPVPVAELVRQAGRRHRIEEVFEEAKGEVGLDHFEVRAWHGWYHHMALCMIALWFLVREKRRLGKKSHGHHRQPDPDGHRAAARATPFHQGRSCVHQLPSDSKPAGSRRAVPSAWALPASHSPDAMSHQAAQ